ncbi:184_t:CDS:1, partial [Racocetra fulgida]
NAADPCTKNSDCISNHCLDDGSCACGNGNGDCDDGEPCDSTGDCIIGACINNVCVCAGNKQGLCSRGVACSGNDDCFSNECKDGKCTDDSDPVPIKGPDLDDPIEFPLPTVFV